MILVASVEIFGGGNKRGGGSRGSVSNSRGGCNKRGGGGLGVRFLTRGGGDAYLAMEITPMAHVTKTGPVRTGL